MSKNEILREILDNKLEIEIWEELNKIVLIKLKEEEDKLAEMRAVLRVIKKINKNKDISNLLSDD